MVVHQYDARRPLSHCRPEDLARVNHGRVQRATGNQHLANDAVSAVQQQRMKLLLLYITEPRPHASEHVCGSTNVAARIGVVSRRAPSQLE